MRLKFVIYLDESNETLRYGTELNYNPTLVLVIDEMDDAYGQIKINLSLPILLANCRIPKENLFV